MNAKYSVVTSHVGCLDDNCEDFDTLKNARAYLLQLANEYRYDGWHVRGNARSGLYTLNDSRSHYIAIIRNR